MSILASVAGPSRTGSSLLPSRSSSISISTRSVSSSPYGRTHVWKHRQRVLPKPFVPQFPQLVVRADGSSYTQVTTSPRSVFRLTRDSTNHPIWNAGQWLGDSMEEDAVTGRLGRFNRKFDGIGGHGGDVTWMDGVQESVEDVEEMKKAVRNQPPEKKKKK